MKIYGCSPAYATMAFVLFGTMISPCPASGGTPASVPPNVILLMADDLGWGDVAYNNNEVVQTPHLDALAREGLRFDRFYAASVCSPAQASCLTGRAGARMNMPWSTTTGQLPLQEVTIAEALKLRGYTTGHFGKWHVGQLSKTQVDSYLDIPIEPRRYSPPWESGFDKCFSGIFLPLFNPYYLTCGKYGSDDYTMVMNRPVARGQRTGGFVWASRLWTGPGQMVDEWLEGPLPEILMDRTLGFIREARTADRPFLACVWFLTPHTPVVAGPRHRALYPSRSIEEQHWFGSISAMDEQIGRLRHALHTMGLAENTVVWFCSDNGPTWVHDLNSAGPFRGKKGSFWEGGIRVPASLVWPARFKNPRVVDASVSTNDFLPTILSWAGQDIPHDRVLDGMDATPILDGEERNRSRPLGFVSPVMRSQAQDTKAWKQIGGQQMAWIDGPMKLISFDEGQKWQLYDLTQDPSESHDIADEKPEVVAKMKSSLIKWIESCHQSAAGHDYQERDTR